MEADGETASDTEAKETQVTTLVLRNGKLTPLAKGERLKPGGKLSWPMKSRGAAVRPGQVQEMERRYPGHKFDRQTGEAIFDSPSHRQRCLRERGFVDLDGYRSGKNV